MSVRTKARTSNADRNSEVLDSTRTQREVTVDGYTFHYGPNEVRNFLDDSVGQRAAAFNAATNVDVVEDAEAYGTSRS